MNIALLLLVIFLFALSPILAWKTKDEVRVIESNYCGKYPWETLEITLFIVSFLILSLGSLLYFVIGSAGSSITEIIPKYFYSVTIWCLWNMIWQIFIKVRRFFRLGYSNVPSYHFLTWKYKNV